MILGFSKHVRDREGIDKSHLSWDGQTDGRIREVGLPNPERWAGLAVGEMRNINSWCCNLLGGDLALQGLVVSPEPCPLCGKRFPNRKMSAIPAPFSVGIDPGLRGREMFPGSQEMN